MQIEITNPDVFFSLYMQSAAQAGSLLFQIFTDADPSEPYDNRLDSVSKHVDNIYSLLAGLAFSVNAITIELHLLPDKDQGDIYTIEEFEHLVSNGTFIDYDGHGYWATKNGESQIKVKPSFFKAIDNFGIFTHIAWYNR